YWTTNWTPELIPEEGFSSMPYPEMLKEMTGVNVEWVITPANSRKEQYSVLLASDDLCDLMGQAFSFHTGSIPDAIEDEYYANLYDYIDYIPNYSYQVVKFDYDKDVLNKIFYDKETIPCFYGRIYDPVPRMGYMIRGDLLEQVGMTAEGMDTYDEVHDALLAVKSAGISDFPMDITAQVEQDYGIFAAGMGTYLYCNGRNMPSPRVVDGKAVFTLTGEDDRKAMQLLSSWFADGLINPNWASITDGTMLGDRLGGDDSVYCFWAPSAVQESENDNSNPNARWDFLVRPRENSGEYLKIGTKIDKFSFGNTAVSAKCENIPLAATWCDWFYSETGSFHASYGPQGLCWDYTEDGEVRYTDFILNHESGTSASWMSATYGINGLCDHGMLHNLRSSAYEGGERVIDILLGWTEPSGEKVYDWPVSCKFTSEETTQITNLSGDLITYMSETWAGFVDGSTPMSQWDAYVQGCYDIGLQEMMDIYQASYERYLAS
ncbi:MAG: extracellular solute-binding protein, partial [Armatimonadetes bacterium]|nr:extracellular solute-binding protein [Armatimonadota bacterium]